MNNVIARTAVHTDHRSDSRIHHKTWGDIPLGYKLSNRSILSRALGSQEMTHIPLGVFTKVVSTLREAVVDAIENWDSYDINTTVRLFTEIVNDYHRETPDGEEG